MRDRLLICATAPVERRPGGLRLDAKFVQGMERHVAQWPGPVTCVLREPERPVPFGVDCAPEDLGFDLVILPRDAPIASALTPQTALVAAAADDHHTLDLVAPAHEAGARLVYSLEYTLETRLRVVWLDQGRNLPRRLWSMLWNIRQERRRRVALRGADGLQCNGFPAFRTYKDLNRDTLLYLDNRMTAAMMATPAEMQARIARLESGAPLRLIHSGRLEPMKGAQHLLPVMEALRARGVNATLDIYGTGSLERSIAARQDAFGGMLRLHPPVDFATELVPINRQSADIFLSCHLQSDPFCSYLEALGCGLAVVGYDNGMWRQLCAASQGGVVAPLGKPAELADAIARLDAGRTALIAHMQAGLEFARAHDFEGEFGARMAHLREVAGIMGSRESAPHPARP